MTLLKINRLLPIYISIVLLKFEVDIESQSKVRVRKPKIKYGCQAAILKVTLLKINRLLLMATNNMHMKFEIEIPKQTWLMLRKPCRLQADGQTDGRTDKVNPVYPPPTITILGGGIITHKIVYIHAKIFCANLLLTWHKHLDIYFQFYFSDRFHSKLPVIKLKIKNT